MHCTEQGFDQDDAKEFAAEYVAGHFLACLADNKAITGGNI